METSLIYPVYPVEGLEIRRRGGGGGRSIRGSFGYSRGRGRGLATLKNRGRRRKERIQKGAFRFSVREIKRLRDDLEKVLKQGYKAEAQAEVEALQQEVARRDVHVLYGHDWNRPLGSVAGGSVLLNETDDGVDFEIDLPDDEAAWPSHVVDTVKQIHMNLIQGISPGFIIPPKDVVPDAEGIEIEESTGVEIRVIKQAILYELSLVSRPAYTDTSIETKAEFFPEKNRRIKLWL